MYIYTNSFSERIQLRYVFDDRIGRRLGCALGRPTPAIRVRLPDRCALTYAVIKVLDYREQGFGPVQTSRFSSTVKGIR